MEKLSFAVTNGHFFCMLIIVMIQRIHGMVFSTVLSLYPLVPFICGWVLLLTSHRHISMYSHLQVQWTKSLKQLILAMLKLME
jgi:hypothetical protein